MSFRIGAAVAAVIAIAPATTRAGEAPSSVYRLRPVTDAIVTSAALAVYSTTLLVEGSVVDRRCPCDGGQVNALDRPTIGNSSATAAQLSDATVALAIVVPVTADALVLGWNQPLLEDAVVFAQTMFVNGALLNAVKLTVQRPRPVTYAGDPEWIERSGGYVSFFSGHTAHTFAALGAASMTIGYRYGSWVWPWVVTGVVGASVAAERVLAGRHFPTDVATGAAVGLALGIGVPWSHRHSDLAVTAAPAGAMGIGVAGRF